jgi:hypothetical protein
MESITQDSKRAINRLEMSQLNITLLTSTIDLKRLEELILIKTVEHTSTTTVANTEEIKLKIQKVLIS